jgi:Xaa-Pro aminopeptidase
MTKEEVSEVSGIDEQRIFYLHEFDDFIGKKLLLDSRHLILEHVPENIYLDMYRAGNMQKPISFLTFKKIINNYPELRIKNINEMIFDMRRVKSEEEVKEIRTAVEHTKHGIHSIFDYAKPGINEREFEATFEYNIKLSGSTGNSFDTIVAGGKNATVLHYVENDQKIQDNTMVLLDLGAFHNEYAADISRTFPINGRFTEKQANLYNLVLDVNKKTIKKIKPGIYVRELNEFAKDALADGMMKLGYIKEKSEILKYYYHNVSHYMGLDVHDVGTYTKKLEPGVVLTVEPGIYIEEEKIGIRIEDDILVTKDGYENLSKDIIKDIKDIEGYFNKKE